MSEPRGVTIRFEGRETFKEQLEALFQAVRKAGLGLGEVADVNVKGAKLWDQLQGMQDLSEVGMGAVIYALRDADTQEVNPDTNTPYKMWQRVQFGQQDGIPLPPSAIWEIFARDQLGISGTYAVNLARNFKVYYEALGISVEDMLEAGVAKLMTARRYLEVHPNDGVVKVAVFGAPLTCDECGQEHDAEPMFCLDCGTAFHGKEAQTLRQVENLIHTRMRQEVGPSTTQAAPQPIWKIEAKVERHGQILKVIAQFVELRNNIEFDLPTWEIDLADIDWEVHEQFIRCMKGLVKG